MQETLGPIELTVVREYNATAATRENAFLPVGSTVDLASIALDLTGDWDAVLLQAVVNWQALFSSPTQVSTAVSGSAEITFELLRDGEVIYRLTQSAVQIAASRQPTEGETNKIATLLHLDTQPLSGLSGQVTYTLRATNIVRTRPTGDNQTGFVLFEALAVSFIAQQVAGNIRGKNKPVYKCVENIFVSESPAPQLLPPAAFPVSLPVDGSQTLARLDLKPNADQDGILLLAVINWRVTFDYLPTAMFAIVQPPVITATFEILRHETPVYRITQSLTQSLVPFANTSERLTTSTYEIAALLHFDACPIDHPEKIPAYTLQATNISITPAMFAGQSPVTNIAVAAGAVTFAAKKINAQLPQVSQGGKRDD